MNKSRLHKRGQSPSVIFLFHFNTQKTLCPDNSLPKSSPTPPTPVLPARSWTSCEHAGFYAPGSERRGVGAHRHRHSESIFLPFSLPFES